jgi:aspartate/methionine/tyrosine aminotransferase
MLTSSLAPYLLWAKTRKPASIDLAGSNLVHCSIDELPGAREAVDLTAPNDNGYAPLVESIARHYGVSPSQVVTAMGCSGANFIAVAALVGAGHHVLIEQPTYDPLIGACRLMGANIERFSRRFEDRWQLDADDVGRRMTPKTKLVIISSPHNPSGHRADRAALEAIGRAADRVGAMVLVDEVYLDSANAIGQNHERGLPAVRLDGPFLSTSSLTKSYGLAGLRSGWIVCRPDLAERLRRTRDVVDNAGPGAADRLAALAFTHLPALIERARRILSGNTQRARAFFDAHPELEIAGPPAASVVFPRLAGVADSQPFVQRLLDEHGVAVAPGHFFDAPAHFRLSLAGRTESLEQGLARLGEALGVRDARVV